VKDGNEAESQRTEKESFPAALIFRLLSSPEIRCRQPAAHNVGLNLWNTATWEKRCLSTGPAKNCLMLFLNARSRNSPQISSPSSFDAQAPTSCRRRQCWPASLPCATTPYRKDNRFPAAARPRLATRRLNVAARSVRRQYSLTVRGTKTGPRQALSVGQKPNSIGRFRRERAVRGLKDQKKITVCQNA